MTSEEAIFIIQTPIMILLPGCEETEQVNAPLGKTYRVENLHKINCKLFAINNDFEKYGEVKNEIDPRERKQSVKGGINGKNLNDSWPRWILRPIDLKTCRGYLG